MTHLAQALTQQRDVAAHTLVLQLLAAEVEGAIAVVNAHLRIRANERQVKVLKLQGQKPSRTAKKAPACDPGKAHSLQARAHKPSARKAHREQGNKLAGGHPTAAHLEVVRLDSIHHHALHLAERHEGHQLCERADAHSAVDLAQLLQQAQNSDLQDRIAGRQAGTFNRGFRELEEMCAAWQRNLMAHSTYPALHISSGSHLCAFGTDPPSPWKNRICTQPHSPKTLHIFLQAAHSDCHPKTHARNSMHTCLSESTYCPSATSLTGEAGLMVCVISCRRARRGARRLQSSRGLNSAVNRSKIWRTSGTTRFRMLRAWMEPSNAARDSTVR
eukprot:scaffold16779_cov20-Tisochrysis_lutea.AAC.2